MESSETHLAALLESVDNFLRILFPKLSTGLSFPPVYEMPHNRSTIRPFQEASPGIQNTWDPEVVLVDEVRDINAVEAYPRWDADTR